MGQYQGAERVRALIVDDHPMVRLAISLLLKQEGIEVVGEAENGTEGLSKLKDLSPDLLILDMDMPEETGLSVIQKVTEQNISVNIMVLTAYPDSLLARHCCLQGVKGFLSKSENLQGLREAVRTIKQGLSYFPPLQEPFRGGEYLRESDEKKMALLSPRELSVLTSLAKGLSNKQIADVMALSNKTISTYKTRVMGKLGVKNICELYDFSRRNGLT